MRVKGSQWLNGVVSFRFLTDAFAILPFVARRYSCVCMCMHVYACVFVCRVAFASFEVLRCFFSFVSGNVSLANLNPILPGWGWEVRRGHL